MEEGLFSQQNKGTPILIGELLYDIFPSHSTEVLGGAALNVAWHLQGMGLHPLLISALGKDALGTLALQAMKEWQMDLAGIQINSHYPTGQVTITLTDGDPEYAILDDQAYDHITCDTSVLKEYHPVIFYHGSLATRHKTTRNTIHYLAHTLNTPIFLDVNLRAPWWNTLEINSSLSHATIVKLNQKELSILQGKCHIPDEKVFSEMVKFREYHNIEVLIVTLGKSGVRCLDSDSSYHVAACTAHPFCDSVGAGDAFSASMIASFCKGRTLQDSLHNAVIFAAKICSQRGAITLDTKLYTPHVTT